MRGFDPRDSFGPEVAARYEGHLRGDEEVGSELLAQLAGPPDDEGGAGGPALELAIGTGRLALPLAARGIEVDGIEQSSAMIDQLRRRPGGERLRVELGDMTEFDMGRRYRLVYLVYNTIYNVLTADGQIAVFENAARHLDDDGRFLIEAGVPGFWVGPGSDGYVTAEEVELDAVGLDVARYDPATQLLHENHVRIGADGVRFSPIVTRLITPGEMDLMARIAGLRLIDRWGSWQREPFGSTSRLHVSVYGPAGSA